MSFLWTYWVPDKNWWANYRWHLTKPGAELGIKNQGWKKSFFRRGWQNKVVKVEGVENAKKLLQNLRNGTITVFGGRFRGVSYDKNAKRIIKQSQRSLKAAIKSYKGEAKIEETAILPPSYYNWSVIIPLLTGIVLIGVIVIFCIWKIIKHNYIR